MCRNSCPNPRARSAPGLAYGGHVCFQEGAVPSGSVATSGQMPHRRFDPLHLRFLLLVNIVSLNIIVAVSGSPRSFAAEQSSDVPAWLRAHIGEGEGQIAQVVYRGHACFT